MIEEEKPSTKKCMRIYEENDTTMAFYKTSDYVVGVKSSESVKTMEVN